jgi:hypothetical protein
MQELVLVRWPARLLVMWLGRSVGVRVCVWREEEENNNDDDDDDAVSMLLVEEWLVGLVYMDL